MRNLDSIFKSRYHFANKGLYSHMVFPVIMYGYESWAIKKAGPKNWGFRTVVLEKTLESPLDSKIKPANPKEKQPWIFIGRADTEAETPTLWPSHAKIWLFGKDPDAGKGWRQENKGTDNEMVGWDHQLNGHEFEQTLGESKGQGSPACCSPWGRKESDTTSQLNTWRSDWKTPFSNIEKRWKCTCICQGFWWEILVMMIMTIKILIIKSSLDIYHHKSLCLWLTSIIVGETSNWKF